MQQNVRAHRFANWRSYGLRGVRVFIEIVMRIAPLEATLRPIWSIVDVGVVEGSPGGQRLHCFRTFIHRQNVGRAAGTIVGTRRSKCVIIRRLR